MRNPRVDSKLERIRQATEPFELSLGGITLTIFPNVYPTSEVSEVIVELYSDIIMGIKKGDRVLDYGTGTGFLAVLAALRGAKVVATDINPMAVECARHNAKKHGVEESVEVRQGNAIEPIDPRDRFEVIVAGLPWDDAEPLDLLEMSMYDPSFCMRRALFDNAIRILSPGGRILLTYAVAVQKRYPLEATDPRYSYQVVRERVIKGEVHYAYLVRPKPTAPEVDLPDTEAGVDEVHLPLPIHDDPRAGMGGCVRPRTEVPILAHRVLRSR